MLLGVRRYIIHQLSRSIHSKNADIQLRDLKASLQEKTIVPIIKQKLLF